MNNPPWLNLPDQQPGKEGVSTVAPLGTRGGGGTDGSGECLNGRHTWRGAVVLVDRGWI